MKKVIIFLKQFNYWKALPSLTTVILLGVLESVFFDQHIIWFGVIISLPLIYILACIKTPFEKKHDFFKEKIELALSEKDPIKQAMKLSAVSMKIANQCAIEAIYGVESEKKYWYNQTKFYNEVSQRWREEVQLLIKENK